MSRLRSRTLLLSLLPLALGAAVVPDRSAVPVCDGPEVPLPTVCGAKLPNPTISCRIPPEVAGDLKQPNFNVRQRAS
ncbi:MAG: hypothetical protein ACJ75H_20720, partial [Thermoanaerobaculia bacterium]